MKTIAMLRGLLHDRLLALPWPYTTPQVLDAFDDAAAAAPPSPAPEAARVTDEELAALLRPGAGAAIEMLTGEMMGVRDPEGDGDHYDAYQEIAAPLVRRERALAAEVTALRAEVAERDAQIARLAVDSAAAEAKLTIEAMAANQRAEEAEDDATKLRHALSICEAHRDEQRERADRATAEADEALAEAEDAKSGESISDEQSSALWHALDVLQADDPIDEAAWTEALAALDVLAIDTAPLLALREQIAAAEKLAADLRAKAWALLCARTLVAGEGGIITGCSTTALLAYNGAAVDLATAVGQAADR